MTAETISTKIFDELNDLPLEQQRQVLAFTRSLKAHPKGVKGTSLLSFAGSISNDDLSQMKSAIQEGCEGIDPSEW